jgi:hypothetical protein
MASEKSSNMAYNGTFLTKLFLTQYKKNLCEAPSHLWRSGKKVLDAPKETIGIISIHRLRARNEMTKSANEGRGRAADIHKFFKK